MPRRVLVFAVVLWQLTLLPVHAANVGGGSEVIVASIDTGIRPTHQEFDYGGPASTSDQIVAWWDFTADKGAIRAPAPGQLWDSRTPDPYDGYGHGTGTAAMAVGRNASSLKTPSFAPGFKLAVAKVGSDSGAITGSIADAVRWATDTVGADVITISIGSIAPIPAAALPVFGTDRDLAALKHARDAGVLVVVANGNGFGNLGVLTGQPGWASEYAMSQNALTVGADDANSFLVSTDPEVVSKYIVTTAAKTGDDKYVGEGGTSFAAPTVAGMAAKAMAVALAHGHPATPDYIEKLLKLSATDLVRPPTFQGYGRLDATSFATVASHAAAGTLPSRSPTDLDSAYEENIVETARDVWSNKLNKDFIALGEDPNTAPSQIGPSTPFVGEAEAYRVTLAPGESTTIKLVYGDSATADDMDLYLYSPGQVFSAQTLEMASTNTSGLDESFTYAAPLGGTFTLLVAGWSVAKPHTFTLSSTSTVPSTPEPAFLGQDVYLNTAIPGF